MLSAEINLARTQSAEAVKEYLYQRPNLKRRADAPEEDCSLEKSLENQPGVVTRSAGNHREQCDTLYNNSPSRKRLKLSDPAEFPPPKLSDPPKFSPPTVWHQLTREVIMLREELKQRIHFGFKEAIQHHLNLEAFARAAAVTARQVFEDKMHAAHDAALAEVAAKSARQFRRDTHAADLKARLVIKQLDGVDAMVVDAPSQPTMAASSSVQATQSVAPTSLPPLSVSAQLTDTYTLTIVSELICGTKRPKHPTYEQNEAKRHKPNSAADEQNGQAVNTPAPASSALPISPVLAAACEEVPKGMNSIDSERDGISDSTAKPQTMLPRSEKELASAIPESSVQNAPTAELPQTMSHSTQSSETAKLPSPHAASPAPIVSMAPVGPQQSSSQTQPMGGGIDGIFSHWLAMPVVSTTPAASSQSSTQTQPTQTGLDALLGRSSPTCLLPTAKQNQDENKMPQTPLTPPTQNDVQASTPSSASHSPPVSPLFTGVIDLSDGDTEPSTPDTSPLSSGTSSDFKNNQHVFDEENFVNQNGRISSNEQSSTEEDSGFVVDTAGDLTIPAACLLDEMSLSEAVPQQISTSSSEDQAETMGSPESLVNLPPRRHERFAKLAGFEMEMEPATQNDKDSVEEKDENEEFEPTEEEANGGDAGAGAGAGNDAVDGGDADAEVDSKQAEQNSDAGNSGTSPGTEHTNGKQADAPAEIDSAALSKTEAPEASAPATQSKTVAKESFTPDDLADYLGQLCMPKQLKTANEIFKEIGPSTDKILIMQPEAAEEAVGIWIHVLVDHRTPYVFQDFLCPPLFPFCDGQIVQYDFKLSDLKADIIEVLTVEAGVVSGKHWNVDNLTLDSCSSPRADDDFRACLEALVSGDNSFSRRLVPAARALVSRGLDPMLLVPVNNFLAKEHAKGDKEWRVDNLKLDHYAVGENAAGETMTQALDTKMCGPADRKVVKTLLQKLKSHKNLEVFLEFFREAMCKQSEDVAYVVEFKEFQRDILEWAGYCKEGTHTSLQENLTELFATMKDGAQTDYLWKILRDAMEHCLFKLYPRTMMYGFEGKGSHGSPLSDAPRRGTTWFRNIVNDAELTR